MSQRAVNMLNKIMITVIEGAWKQSMRNYIVFKKNLNDEHIVAIIMINYILFSCHNF